MTQHQNAEVGPSVLGLLFNEDSERAAAAAAAAAKNTPTTTSPGMKGYLQMNSTDDKFPILVRRDSYPNIVSKHHPGSKITPAHV